ncbi:OsmC family protein [Donghicola mangrovi]|uniref:OsmC family protein n=1 Tax=Donghicola mangrovi TaxID=2729614 RepID=A0A850QA51_9RHOB|nr:OsmC family protein [Donghicola mangrovi]NVO23690.1 OsmC family protein [Donghicola mangrovi]
MINKQGSAHWTGSLKEGKGYVSTESGALDDQPYGFNTRFEDGVGTNPEEIIGAAHAACFSMALSMILDQKIPDSIATTATVSMDKDGEGFAVKKIHLDVTGTVPGITEEEFITAATTAKENCPISRLLMGGTAEITMDAKLA